MGSTKSPAKEDRRPKGKPLFIDFLELGYPMRIVDFLYFTLITREEYYNGLVYKSDYINEIKKRFERLNYEKDKPLFQILGSDESIDDVLGEHFPTNLSEKANRIYLDRVFLTIYEEEVTGKGLLSLNIDIYEILYDCYPEYDPESQEYMAKDLGSTIESGGWLEGFRKAFNYVHIEPDGSGKDIFLCDFTKTDLGYELLKELCNYLRVNGMKRIGLCEGPPDSVCNSFFYKYSERQNYCSDFCREKNKDESRKTEEGKVKRAAYMRQYRKVKRDREKREKFKRKVQVLIEREKMPIEKARELAKVYLEERNPREKQK